MTRARKSVGKVSFVGTGTGDAGLLTARAVEVLASAEVAVDDVPFQTRRDLHDRYRIDAVPTVVVADSDGVVRAHHVGPCTAADLWAAVADARGEGGKPPS